MIFLAAGLFGRIPVDRICAHAAGFNLIGYHSNFMRNQMQSLFEDIKDFHRKFGLAYDGPPRVLNYTLEKFRVGFMAEELAEYLTDNKDFQKKFIDMANEALLLIDSPSREKQLDALVDMVYVILGTAYMKGWDFDEAWRRVHEANMKKVRALRAVDSARGSLYDVIKPEGWVAPDLKDLV